MRSDIFAIGSDKYPIDSGDSLGKLPYTSKETLARYGGQRLPGKAR
jgi:hypothetical protein